MPQIQIQGQFISLKFGESFFLACFFFSLGVMGNNGKELVQMQTSEENFWLLEWGRAAQQQQQASRKIVAEQLFFSLLSAA
jgi:hypothetical protein